MQGAEQVTCLPAASSALSHPPPPPPHNSLSSSQPVTTTASVTNILNIFCFILFVSDKKHGRFLMCLKTSYKRYTSVDVAEHAHNKINSECNSHGYKTRISLLLSYCYIISASDHTELASGWSTLYVTLCEFFIVTVY